VRSGRGASGKFLIAVMSLPPFAFSAMCRPIGRCGKYRVNPYIYPMKSSYVRYK
jgi:hypothetical protein